MSLKELNAQITTCSSCVRLVLHRANVNLNSNYRERYWSRGVPGIGDPSSEILIVGLAPGAHGAIELTGDFSGDKLFAALERNGLYSRSLSSSQHEGMHLSNVYITEVENMSVHMQSDQGKGSLYDIQKLVNQYPELFRQHLIRSRLPADRRIDWVSPRREKGMAGIETNTNIVPISDVAELNISKI